MKLVLSGQGAHEPFAGYQHRPATAEVEFIEPLPCALAGPARIAADAVPRPERLQRAAGLCAGFGAIHRLLRVFELTNRALRSELTARSGIPVESERVELASQYSKT
jgi:asparagine synthetase B (glutamine-hydrolysing)